MNAINPTIQNLCEHQREDVRKLIKAAYFAGVLEERRGHAPDADDDKLRPSLLRRQAD